MLIKILRVCFLQLALEHIGLRSVLLGRGLVAALMRNGPNYRNNWTDSSSVPRGFTSCTENGDDHKDVWGHGYVPTSENNATSDAGVKHMLEELLLLI